MKKIKWLPLLMVMMLLFQQVTTTAYAVTTSIDESKVEQVKEIEEELVESTHEVEKVSEELPISESESLVEESVMNTEEEAQAPPVEELSQLKEQTLLDQLQSARSTSEQEQFKAYFFDSEKELRSFAQTRGLGLGGTFLPGITANRNLPAVPGGAYPTGTNFYHDNFTKWQMDGKVVFCIQEGNPTWVNASYNNGVPLSNFLTNATLVKKLNLIAYFGWYANSDKSNNQYAATQLMIWEAFGGTTNSTTISNYATRKASINSKINAYQKASSLKGSTITVKAGETVTKTDTNGVLSEYFIKTNTANVDAKISGNKLEITGKANSNANGILVLEKKMAVTPSNSLVYRKGILQALGFLNDPNFMNDTINIKVTLNGQVKIKKVDEAGKALANAKFKYSYGDKTGEVTSDKNGEALLKDITAGTKVTVNEIQSPTGYVLNNEPQTVTVKASETATLTFKNKKIRGNIELVKYADEEWTSNATQTFLQGAEFTLFSKDGKTSIAKATTDEVGKVSFKNIEYNEYLLRETKTPEGYTPVADMSVTIKTDGETIQLTATDKVIRESLKLIKLDEESNQSILTKDAQFTIKNLQTNELVTHTDEFGQISSVFVTDENGVIFIPQLKYGWYEVTEIFAPNGYIQLKEPVKFKVDGTHGEFITLNITNKPAKGKVIVNKLGQKEVAVEATETEYGDLYTFNYDYLDLGNVTYELHAAEPIVTGDGIVHYDTDQLIKEATTDETGHFEVTNLYPGNYYLIEKEAPNGFIKDKEKVPFEIRYEGQEVELTQTDVAHKNNWNEFQVMVNKEEEVITGWENNEPVIEVIPSQSKVFGLFKREGFSLNEEQVMPENSLVAITKTIHGVATFQGQLPEGEDYYIKELNAGNDHVLDETEYPVNLTPQDNREVVQANVYANKTFVGNENFNRMERQPILNKLARQTIQLIKVDATSYVNEKYLEGVAFDLVKIQDEEEIKVGEFLTDEKGEITIENLPTGKYKFVETQPLENYLPNSEDLSFEVQPSTDGEVIIIKAHNERVAPTLGTLLTDLNGQKLIDSLVDNTLIDTLDYTGILLGKDEKYDIHFELWERSNLGASHDKQVAKTVAKDVVFEKENGKYDMRLAIPAGTLDPSKTYYAKEFVYRKSKENPTPEKPFVKHDDRDSKEQTITTKAKLVVFLPQTGESRTLLFTTIGSMMLLAFGAAVFIKRRIDN